MLLARNQGGDSVATLSAILSTKLHGTVNENVVSWWWASSMRSCKVDLEEWLVEPVSDRVEAKIDIVVSCRRPIDNDATDNTISILCRVMAVVPIERISE